MVKVPRRDGSVVERVTQNDQQTADRNPSGEFEHLEHADVEPVTEGSEVVQITEKEHDTRHSREHGERRSVENSQDENDTNNSAVQGNDCL